MGQSALKGYLGRKAHVAQLNAAGKHMAAMHGWEVRAAHCCSRRGLLWLPETLRPSRTLVLARTRHPAWPPTPTLGTVYGGDTLNVNTSKPMTVCMSYDSHQGPGLAM